MTKNNGTPVPTQASSRLKIANVKTGVVFGLLSAAIFAAFQKGNYLNAFFASGFIFLLGESALYLLWRWTGKSPKLRVILAVALFLRLAAAISLTTFLPVNGYQDSEQQQAGYVFYDAYRRDTAAFDLAQSEAPLLSAFSKKQHTDQYGGLLALSAGVYRLLSPDAHRPLLIALIAAFAAVSGIPFLWMAAKELGGEKQALFAAWIFALYPEAILMGSSQMREPFLMSGIALTFWAFLLRQKNKKASRWLLLGLLLLLLISPAIAVINLAFLGIYALVTHRNSRISSKQTATALALFLVSLFILSAALGKKNINASSPFGIILEWTQKAVHWDAYQLERGSGWVQKLFSEMPPALHIPFVTAYGLTQPVLPAALIEPTTLIWKILGIMRAAGWYLLAPILLYGLTTLPKHNSAQARRVWTWIGLAAWSWIIIASLRAGGDQWDNPRYRVIFLALQALFAAQAWMRKDAWLPRILTVEAIFLAFFTQWYASRYYARFDTLSFGAMVGWILSLSAGVIIIGIIQDRKKTL
jgi:hypothetical protein